MGRRPVRSRKRGAELARAPSATPARDACSPARRARRRRARVRPPPASERPKAPWGSFPLSELIILVGIVVIFWGLFSGGGEGNERVAAGLVLASLGGGELALREHLAGFRSHSTLLAGVAAFVVSPALRSGWAR